MNDTTRKIIIRDAIPADVPRCQQLDHSYETEYVWKVSLHQHTSGHSIDLHEERLPRTMEVTVQADEPLLRYALAPQRCFLVATTADDELLGYLLMLPDEVNPIATLKNTTTGKPHRGRGVGLRLLRVAQQWARQHQLDRIIAETQTKNYPAISLYQQAGFSFCGFNDQYFTNRDIAVFFCLSVR